MKLTFWEIIIILLIGCSCSVSEKRIPGYDDIIKAESLMEQYRDSVMTNPKSVINFFSDARDELTDSISSYLLLAPIANSYYFLNEVDTAMVLFQRILDFSEHERENANHDFIIKRLKFLKSSVFTSLGVYYSQIGLLDSAAVYFDKSIQNAPSVASYINLADIYLQKGDFPSASRYYRRVLFLVDSLNQGELHYFSIFSGMAKLYQDLDNFAMAEQYYQQASRYSENVDVYAKIYFETTLGNFYFFAKEYEKALECHRKSDRLADATSQPLSHAIPKTNIGEVYIMLEQPDSARFYLNQAKELLGPLFSMPQFNFYITGLYAALALLEGDMREAEKLLLHPFDTLSVNPQYLYFHNRRMQDFYLRKKDFEKAFHYRMEAETYNDSIRSVKVRNNIAEIDARYSQDTTLLRKDILIAQTENRALQWRNTTVAIVALLVFVLLSVAGIILYIRKRNEIRLLQQQATNTGLRMEIIRNRLSPHFIFNTLNLFMPVLRKYSDMESPFRRLVQFLRDHLVASEQIATPLQQEIERVQNFLQLQALKPTVKIRTDWHIPPDTPMDTLVPSMSIQIPAENALKYAFLPDCTDAHLQFLIKQENEVLYVAIEDNGVGYHPDRQSDPEKGSGSGLKMLRQTIELLNAKNSAPITFKIENKGIDTPPGQGTHVSLQIPVNYTFEL